MRTELVNKMHAKFNIPQQTLMDLDFIQFRQTAMLEELVEFMVAVQKHDYEGVLDALVDLAVFLDGTVDLLGLGDVFDEAYARVMVANLKKELAGDKTGKRGWAVDLKKPKDWQAPVLDDLVRPF